MSGSATRPAIKTRSLPKDRSSPVNQVVVMGMMHRRHLTSESYGIEVVKDIIRAVEPDLVLTEIPPDRLDTALGQFRTTGTVTEPRLRLFPEYVDALFPLTREMDFEIVACAAWTQDMANARQAKLKQWKTTRPEDSARVQAAKERAQKRLIDSGLYGNPMGMHSPQYDEIVESGMRPYNELFNDELGPGGWDNINAAHMALIGHALDEHTGQGKRILIMFGSWHKYWLLRALAKRSDIELVSLREFLR